MNVFSFTGNLGNDSRVGNSGGSAVCNFSVAVKSGYGDKAQTIWVDCALWGKQAESKLPDYLKKGQMVAVSGELGTRQHDGKTYITCRVTSVSLCGGRGEQSGSQTAQQSAAQQHHAPYSGYGQPATGFDDDVPF